MGIQTSDRAITVSNALPAVAETKYESTISKRQFGTRFKEQEKAVFFCKKENSALSEHTCLTNHTIGWDNSKIITTNRRYHQRLCLEAWHIYSAHAPLYRDQAVCLLTHIYTSSEKRPIISDHLKGPLVAAFRSPWWRH